MRKLSLVAHVAFQGCFTHAGLDSLGPSQPPVGLLDDTPGRPGKWPYKAASVRSWLLPWPVFQKAMKQCPQTGKGREQLAPN